MSRLAKIYRLCSRLLPAGECLLCLDETRANSLCSSCLSDLPIYSISERVSYVPLISLPNVVPLQVYSVFRYQWPVDKMQHQFKYSKAYIFGRALSSVFSDYLKQDSHYLGDDGLIVPVPMHWRRRWYRGIDHSRVQANAIGKAVGLPVSYSAVRRVNNTPSQVGLKKSERQKSLRNAFRCLDEVEGKNIIVFDDVLTTGSTMQAVATILYKAGAADVRGLSISRAE